jgi:hypothetical protein
LASGSHDGTARIWDAATWEAVGAPLTAADPGVPDESVEAVAFAPDGGTLAMATLSGGILLWNLNTRDRTALPRAHANAVTCVTFSPDGRTLASGSSDETIRLWNVATGRELMVLNSKDLRLGEVRSLAFSPDGTQLLAGATGAGVVVWSTAPSFWGDPTLAASPLKPLLTSPADFQSRVRMLSEIPQLPEALGTLDAQNRHVQAALAAARASRHGARQQWTDAARAFDRLVAADPTNPEGWLRTPGLLRLAMALLHDNRPRDAAPLLAAAAGHRAFDRLSDDDRVIGELLRRLRAAIQSRLAQEPRNPGLLELRAELGGLGTDMNAQTADYTAAIDALSQQKSAATAADLRRLYSRRGNAYLALKQWQLAVDDYARAVTDATTDDDLLSNQALALAELRSSKRWTILRPDQAKSEGGATLSILPDDSILASAANPRKDRYRVIFTAATGVNLAAVRLEALTHPSLPANGPGRYPGRAGGRFAGNFAQSSWNVTAALPNQTGPIQLEFDHTWPDDQLDGFLIGKDGYWNIGNAGQGQNRTAIWSMAKPFSLAAGTKLKLEMQYQSDFAGYENLGHFRLSVSSDPAAIEQERKYSALTDPWEKLAVAYQLQGDQRAIDQLVQRRPKLAGFIGDLFTQEPNRNLQRAVAIYNQGLEAKDEGGRIKTESGRMIKNTSGSDLSLIAHRSSLRSRRARAYEALKKWDAASADWTRTATGNPDGAKLLAEFAQRLAAAGQGQLASAQFDKAQALYERSLAANPENDVVATELAQLLLDKQETGPWAKRVANSLAKATTANPKLPAANWLVLALAHVKLKEIDPAKKACAQAAELRKPSGADAALLREVLIGLGPNSPEATALLAAAAGQPPAALNAAIERNPGKAQGYLNRADWFADWVRWKEASADLAEAFRLEPNTLTGLRLATLLVRTGEIDRYRAHCRAMLERWGSTEKNNEADQTLKTIMLVPDFHADAKQLARLAEVAVSGDKKADWFEWFALGKGLHDYRTGKYAEALTTCRESRLRAPESKGHQQALASLNLAIEAMALYRSADEAGARRTLAEAKSNIGVQVPGIDHGGASYDWLNADMLYREAEGLIAGKKAEPRK